MTRAEQPTVVSPTSRRPCRRFPRARRASPAALPPAEAVVERPVRRRHRRCTRPARACAAALQAAIVPGGEAASGPDTGARPSPSPPCSGPGSLPRALRSRTAGPAVGAHRALRAARPALDDDRRGRCGSPCWSSRPLWLDWTPDDALPGSWSRSSSSASPSACGPCQGERGARAAARAAAGGRRRTPAARPPGRAAPASLRTGFVALPARGRRAGRRHADRQSAGHRHRVVHAAPGRARLVRRRRTVRRFRLDRCTSSNFPARQTPRPRSPLEGCAGRSTATAPVRQGPYGRDPAAGARLRRGRRGHRRRGRRSPCCTPWTWAAARPPSRCSSSP